ncbi:MAG: endonuclease V [Methanomassiliicoccales archaeon]|nr:endonuclease V [Methanomassiliicoccales archaeon]
MTFDRDFHLQDHDLYLRTFELAAQIPEGRVSTYGAIARALGDLVASRAVGQIMSADRVRPFPVPCHRVIYSDGRTGWYTGAGKGEARKQELLRAEGVPSANGKVLNFDKVLFEEFKGDRLLERMAQAQIELAKLIVQEGDAIAFGRIAGLDVAYDGDRAYAAMVVVDRRGKVLETRDAECLVNFPYVPGYLGFREMLPYSKLLDGGREDTLYLIDGHGRAHPRRAGIASQFGLVHGVASAGVAKSVLTGRMEQGSLSLGGEEVGRVVKNARGKARFLSVGHKVELGSLARLYLSLPVDPLDLAHERCTESRRGGKA